MDVLRFLDLELAVGAAAIALAGLGGAWSRRLDVLTHLAPMTLAMALVALAGAVVSGGGLAMLPAAAGVAASLALIVPELLAGRGGAPRGPTGRTLEVIQFNLWRANADAEATAAWLAARNADILVLEEAVRAGAAVPAALAGLYPFRVPAAGERASTVILSKERPTASGLFPSTAEGRRMAAVWARFGTADEAFTVVGVHLAWPFPDAAQRRQIGRLLEQLEGHERGRLIVAGDFNSTPWSFTLRRLDRRLGIARRTRALATWPARSGGLLPYGAPFPLLPIDHLWAGPEWRTVSVRRGPRLGSDHYPVMVTLARED